MLSVLQRIINEYGEESVLTNMPRANAMLLDLAPGLTRERMLVRSFIEVNGYALLKNAGAEYPLVKSKLVHTLRETFCMEPAAAVWVTDLFAAALGYETQGIDSKLNWEDSGPEVKADSMPGCPVGIGKAHIVAVAEDGTVFSHGNNEHYQCDVAHWRGIVSVAAGDEHTLGLRADGTVLAAGANTFDQCDVSRWENIASIYAFGHDTVGVTREGKTLAAGRSQLDVSRLEQITSVAKYPEGILGIRTDGKVMAAGKESGRRDTGESEGDYEEARWAEGLTGAAQIISTYVNGSIVLKKDGRIYKMGEPENYFAQWRDIVSIADLSDSFAILRFDGTVRILPYDRDMKRKASPTEMWFDITAIFGKYKRLIGLTNDGRLLSACTDIDFLRRNGPLNFVKDWYPILR